MPSYTAPIRDMEFVLNEVLNVTGSDVAGYADLEPEFTSAILEEAGKIASGIAMKQLTYRDIKTRRDALRDLVKQLRGA